MSEAISETIPEPNTEQVTETETQIQALLSRAADREQKAKRLAFYLTVIPAALALILLMGTGLQMRSANDAVSNAQTELADTEKEIQTLSLQLDNTNETLETTQQEVVAANEALTETLVTLEVVTGDLVETQDQLTQTKVEYEGLIIEFDGLQEKVNIYHQEIIELNRQIDELHQSLDSVREELKAATDINRYRFQGDWLLTVKNIATRYPAAGDLLQTIVELQETQWYTGGFSPDLGFDSPSFATYVLQVNDRLGEESTEYRYALREYIPNRREGPRVGDIVFYQGGYTMFYFVDDVGVPFVIGMTTQGVLALSPEFAPILGYGATEF